MSLMCGVYAYLSLFRMFLCLFGMNPPCGWSFYLTLAQYLSHLTFPSHTSLCIFKLSKHVPLIFVLFTVINLKLLPMILLQKRLNLWACVISFFQDMYLVVFELSLLINFVLVSSRVLNLNGSLIEGNHLFDNTSSTLQVINSTQFTSVKEDSNYDISTVRHSEIITKRFRNKDYDKTLLDLNYCQKKAKCETLKYTTCMGAKLPYHSSTLNLTDLTTEEQAQERLQLYQYLRYVPKCWAVIQPFLCALYMPKCENDFVDLPSKEMCKVTLRPCKIFYDSGIFPEFMQCDDEELFQPKCKNDIHELKFNTTGFCMEPLVRTDQPDWFYPGMNLFFCFILKISIWCCFVLCYLMKL